MVNNNNNNKTVDLFDYNTIQIIYNDYTDISKIDINKNDISSNIGKIDKDKNDISANLEKIDKINTSKTHLKNIYNILFYDKKTRIDFRNLFYEKLFEVNAKQNDFIEINF